MVSPKPPAAGPMAPDPLWNPPRLTDVVRRRQLLAQADLAYDQQHAVFGALETKAGQYLMVASIGLASAAAFAPADTAARLANAPPWLFALTVGTVVFVVVSGISVLACALQALRIHDVSRRATNPRDVFATFQSPADNFDELYAARTLEAADAICAINDRKAEWLQTTLHGLYFFIASLVVLGVFCTILSVTS